MNTTSAPRLVLLLKSGPGTGAKIAHQAGFALYGGRWHKITADKPAPKGAPVAAHPKSAGHHEPAAHFTDDQWAALKLPDSNVNAPVFNKALEKLKAWSDAGDVTAIVGASYGSNTYGQKLAKVANTLLGMHGSAHKVAAGQKPGTHAAAQVAEPADPHPTGLPEHLAPKAAAPEAEPPTTHVSMASAKAKFQKLVNEMSADGSWADLEELLSEGAPWAVAMVKEALAKKPAQAAASGPLSMPDFEEGVTTTGVKAHYEKVAQKVIDHGHAGNGSVLDDLKADGLKPNAKGKVSNTWAGKTANSKKLLALHAAAVAHATGGAAPAADPLSVHDTPASKVLHVIPSSDPKAGYEVHVATPKSAPGSKFSVAVKDVDSGEFMPSIKVFPKESDALEHAHALADGKKPGAAAEPFSVKSAKPGHLNNEGAVHTLHASDFSGVEKALGLERGDLSDDDSTTYTVTDHKGRTFSVYKHLGALSVRTSGKNTDAASAKELLAHLQDASIGAPKEGDTKPGSDGAQLVFKNGRWHKYVDADESGEVPPVLVPVSEPAAGLSPEDIPAIEGYTSLGKKTIAEANAAALSGDVAGLKQIIADITQPGDETYKPLVHAKKLLALLEAKAGGGAPEIKSNPDGSPVKPDVGAFHSTLTDIENWIADGNVDQLHNSVTNLEGLNSVGAKAAMAYAKAGIRHLGKKAPTAPASSSPLSSAQQLQNLQSIPWYKLKLPPENSNAKSHNAAVSKIEAMAFAGDKAGLKAFIDAKAGAKQTYAKKQALLAQTALAALGVDGATAAVPVEPAPVATGGPAADTPIPANVKKTIDGMSKDKSALEAVVANNAHNPHIAAYAASKLAALKAAAAPDPYPIVSEWKAAIVAGKVPTKAQAEAFETLGDAAPDTQMEYFLDAVTASIPSSVPNHGDEFDAAYQAANDSVHKLHGHALAGTQPAAPAAAAPAKKLTPTEKKLVQIDPAQVEAWMDAKPGEAGPYSGFFDFVGTANKTKFHKWSAAAKKNAYSETQQGRFKSQALCSLFGKHDKCLISTGEFLSVGQPIPAGATLVTDAAAIKDAVLSGKKPDAPAIAADTPLGRKQLAALESLSLNELKAIQNGPGLGVNVLAWIDKKVAELNAQDLASITAGVKQPVPTTTVSATLLHNTQPGHSKFWAVSLSPDGLSMMTTYGKIGTKGQQTVKTFPTQAQASVALNKLIDEKKDKGYKYQGQTDHLHGAAGADAGPKEGDTKQGADGMLVLKDGHWVKMDQGGGAAAKFEYDPSNMGFGGAATLLAESDDKLIYLSKTDEGYQFGSQEIDSIDAPDDYQDHAFLSDAVAAMKAKGLPVPSDEALQKLDPSYKPASAKPAKIKKATLIDISTAIQTITPGQTKFSNNGPGKLALAAAKAGDGPGIAAAYTKAKALSLPKTTKHIKAVAEAMGVDTSSWDGAPAPAAATAPPAAPAAPVAAGGTMSMDGWTQTGGQGGSNPGGKFKDPTGQEWYCKFPKDADTAKSEILAAKLYALAGLSSQDAVLVTKDGKVGIASKWANIKKAASPGALAKVDGAQAGFVVDAWLGNWDVVGLSYDNLQVGPDGKAHRVDAGGSLEYRAQGEKKAFGSKVDELDTLMDAGKNAQTASVFKSMTKADLAASAAKVLAISDVAIRAMVNQYGPGDVAAKAKLAETLIARKKDIAAKFPEAAKKKKAPVFKPEDISAPPSFINWGGTGKSGPSSKEFLNQANEDAVQAIFAAAKTGSIAAIESLKAKVYDKDSGKVTGESPVLAHPSQHVKGYAQQAVNEINYQLNPPKQFRFDGGHPLHSLNAAYPAFTGPASSSVAQKLGKFIVLGEPGTVKLEDLGLPAKLVHSEGGGSLSAHTYAKQAQAAIAKMPATQKQAVKSYTGSSYHAMNGSLWSGNPTGAAKAAGEALKTLGHDITPGTVLSRKISLHGADLDQLLAASGKILQEPAIMSTSIRPSSWSGNVQLKLHIGPGVKGLWVGHHSIAGGGALSSNSGEDEMILPPGTRLMIIGVKSGADSDGFGKSSKHVVEAIVLPT